MENNYQLSRIHNYVHGLLSRDDMHALEREALDDPFLQDAIDGYKLQHGVDAKQLSILQQRLADRVQSKAVARNKRFYSWQRLAVGMAAGVMFLTVCTLLLMKYLPQRNQNMSVLREVEIAPIDNIIIKISPHSKSPATPSIAWSELEERLYINLNKESISGDRIEAFLTFDIDDSGKAFHIKLESKAIFELDFKKALEDIVWKGNAKGSYIFYISISKVKD